jgi:hypothetical protein
MIAARASSRWSPRFLRQMRILTRILVISISALAIGGCGSSQSNTGYFNMHTLADAVANESVTAYHERDKEDPVGCGEKPVGSEGECKLSSASPEGLMNFPGRQEQQCIRIGKQTAECQFPVQITESETDRTAPGKHENHRSSASTRTVNVTISTDGRSYIAHWPS